MNALRWLMMIGTAAAMIGFVALLALADGFRRSFGASENGPLVAILPLMTGLLFLGALLWPEQRALQHVAAITALILAGLSIWVLQESGFVGSVGLIYSGLWGLWYWHEVWRTGP